MSEANETVREVCAEQLELPSTDRNHDWQVACLMFRDELQRMKREMAAKDAEIARLKAALKPVINACAEDAKCDAVREAQRIIKEGGAE